MKNLNHLPSLFALLLFLIIWETSVWLFNIEKWILPSPSQILTALWEKKDLIIIHSTQTIMETLLGLAVAVAIGILIAVTMEWSKLFKKIIYPFLVMSQTVPFIALAPLLVIWLGYGIFPKIIVIALACFFPISLNFYDGFKSVDQNILRLLKSMNATKWQIFTLLKVPSALPQFFSGLRLAATYAVGTAVVSEWIGAERGLGIFLVRSAKSYLTDSVFAVIFVVTFLSLLSVFLVNRLTRAIIPWYFYKKI